MIGAHGEGLCIDYSDSRSWLTLFYALPLEIIEKQKEYLAIPRCPYEVLRTDKYADLINDELFLQLVWDSYAWAAWQCFRVPGKDGTYRDIPGIDLFYSGEFALWRMAYYAVGLIREQFQKSGLGFQELFGLDQKQEIPYLSYQQWSNLIRNAMDRIIAEQNWQPVIDGIWNSRTPEDYSEYYSRVKAAFESQWNHSRTKAGKGMLSLEAIMESGPERKSLFEIPDRTDYSEEAVTRLCLSQFLSMLSGKDRDILQLKSDGLPDWEIAERVGYKTHSAVVKRMKRISECFDEYIKNSYASYRETFNP